MKKVGCLFALLLGVPLLQAAELNKSAPTFPALADDKGKIVFINFWASWCAPCQIELPFLRQLAEDYKGRKVKVLAINVDENRQAARKLLKKLGLTNSRMEIVWDRKSKIVRTYNIDTMPSSFILDSRGVIRYIHSGFHEHDPQAWRQEIDHLRGSSR